LTHSLCRGRFSAEGTPYAVDSAGIVRMLSSEFGKTWIEVANLTQHVSPYFQYTFITLIGCVF